MIHVEQGMRKPIYSWSCLIHTKPIALSHACTDFQPRKFGSVELCRYELRNFFDMKSVVGRHRDRKYFPVQKINSQWHSSLFVVLPGVFCSFIKLNVRESRLILDVAAVLAMYACSTRFFFRECTRTFLTALLSDSRHFNLLSTHPLSRPLTLLSMILASPSCTKRPLIPALRRPLPP